MQKTFALPKSIANLSKSMGEGVMNEEICLSVVVCLMGRTDAHNEA
jgi:hypothetical protein